MRPVSVRTFISAPREDVFDYVADYANRVAWTDHYLKDFRLTRVNTRGLGAGGAFLVDAPFFPLRAEFAVVRLDRPRRIAEQGRVGRVGRTTAWTDLELAAAQGGTEASLTVWTEPGTRLDAFKEGLGARPWLRRQLVMALGRLRLVFEEEREKPLARATIAGYEPLKAARFGA